MQSDKSALITLFQAAMVYHFASESLQNTANQIYF